MTIEAGVFAVPLGAPAAESVHNYVSTLVHWRNVLRKGYANVFTSQGTQEVLVRCNHYPWRPRLRDLLIRTAVVEYDANTIAILAETLMAQSGTLEEATGIRDVVVEALSISPDIFGRHAPTDLKWESEKCAVIVAIVRTVCKDRLFAGHGIVTSSRGEARDILVRAVIAIIEHNRTDLGSLPVSPNPFEGTAVVCEKFEDYVHALDDHALWRAAIENEDLVTAIKVAIYRSRVARNVRTNWESLPTFRINRRFYETARRSGALSSESLARRAVRAVVETVEDLQLTSTHILRMGKGPLDPQRTRGGDLAWRRDIDDQFHLHYWQCADRVKELACIVSHNDFDICS